MIEMNLYKDFTIGFFNDGHEFRTYLTDLDQAGRLNVDYAGGDGTIYVGLTVNEKKKNEESKIKGSDSKTCFVAMSFDFEKKPILVELYENGIKPAIIQSGYKPFRVDIENTLSPQSDMKIDDRIVAGIENAKFVIADFTGQKTAVYWESGYAMGMKIKVIPCCHNEEVGKLSFDTRQYPHVLWSENKLNEFCERLKERILNEFGPGDQETRG